MPSILWSVSVPPAAKHPHNMILPPPYFTVEMVFSDLQASPFFLQMLWWSLWLNSSILVSLEHRTCLQKWRSLSLCFSFHTKASSTLDHRTRLLPEWYDGWTFPWCLYLHIIVWTMNVAPSNICKLYNEPDLWRSTILFLILAEFFWFIPWCHKEAVCLKYIHRCAFN